MPPPLVGGWSVHIHIYGGGRVFHFHFPIRNNRPEEEPHRTPSVDYLHCLGTKYEADCRTSTATSWRGTIPLPYQMLSGAPLLLMLCYLCSGAWRGGGCGGWLVGWWWGEFSYFQLRFISCAVHFARTTEERRQKKAEASAVDCGLKELFA